MVLYRKTNAGIAKLHLRPKALEALPAAFNFVTDSIGVLINNPAYNQSTDRVIL